MSLFSSIQMASNTLQADQIGLQVVGQNIANANTPSYIRETVQLEPGPTMRVGNLLLGSGVTVAGVTQDIDTFLEQRLQGAMSDSSDTQAQATAYTDLEQATGALSSTDMSTLMTNFFNSVSDVLNNPQDVPTRNSAVLQGTTLTQAVNSAANGVSQLQSSLNDQVAGMATSINSLTSEISQLNVQIAQTQGGNNADSEAVGLLDQRTQDLESLSNLINIRVQSDPGGGVSVYCGDTYLVMDGTSRPVETTDSNVNGVDTASVSITATGETLDPTSGQLHGLLTARDQVLGGFTSQLNSFAQTLAFEFNKVYSSGQGLTGYQTTTSEFGVDDPTAALNAAGLTYTPSNGSFQVIVQNTQTGESTTNTVNVNLTGTGQQTTLQSLASQLNSISGLSASINTSGQLTINSSSSDEEFAFANDNSGTLAALGINTFFSGTTAADLGVNSVVQNDPGKFAASQGGIGQDTQNATTLANFMNQPLASQNGETISTVYDNFMSTMAQDGSVAQSTSTASQSYLQTLQGQKTSVSGVDLDEEAVNMMTLQSNYDASAKYITTIQQLLSVLVQL
jgi:flagellar hook-associated protein 1 FlgK